MTCIKPMISGCFPKWYCPTSPQLRSLSTIKLSYQETFLKCLEFKT